MFGSRICVSTLWASWIFEFLETRESNEKKYEGKKNKIACWNREGKTHLSSILKTYVNHKAYWKFMKFHFWIPNSWLSKILETQLVTIKVVFTSSIFGKQLTMN